MSYSKPKSIPSPSDSERDIEKSGKKRDNLTNTDDDGRKATEDDGHDPTEATQTTLQQHSPKRNKKIKMEGEATAQREREHAANRDSNHSHGTR
jgi:hypothetical protein